MKGPSRKKPPPQTLIAILGSPLSLAIEQAVREVYNGHPGPTIIGRHKDCDAIEEAVDLFLHGRVVDADIVMYDRTPMIKVNIRHHGKTYRVNKATPLRHMLATKMNGNPMSEALAAKILPLLPQDHVASQMANIENAAAATMLDEKKLAPIRERFNAKRAADKERLMTRIREVFKDHDDLVSEDEVLQAWRETFAAEVMES
jgi:hypothetical protein